MKAFRFLVAVNLVLGLVHLHAMKENSSEKVDEALKLVVLRLASYEDDPMKQLSDAKENEAFKLLMKSDLSEEQISKLSQVASGYVQIVYDFPFAYPRYDAVAKEDIQKTSKSYSDRLNELNRLLCNNVEWM